MSDRKSPTLDTDRLQKLRDFLHLNATKGGQKSRFRAISITLFVVVLLGVGYFFLYVERQKDRFDEERFQALSQVARQFDQIVYDFQRVHQLSEATDLFTEDSLSGFRIAEGVFLPYTLLFDRIPEDNRFSEYLLFDDTQIHYQTLDFTLGGAPQHPQAGEPLLGPYIAWVELGQRRYRLYGARTESSPSDGQIMRIGALVPEADYQRETFQTNPLVALILSIVAALVLISLPILKVFLINEFEAFNLRDTMLASMSVVLGVPLLLIVLLSTWEQTEHQQVSVKKDLLDLRRSVRVQLEGELLGMSAFLQKMDSASNDYLNTFAKEMQAADPLAPFFGSISYPIFNEVIWLNASGEPSQILSAYPPQEWPESLKERNYFSKIMEEEGWGPQGIGRPWYLESITSWVSGQQEAVLSMPSQRADNEVVAVSAPLGSMFQTILPKNSGFAVVDEKGRVLFHSVSERNTEENFLYEIGNLPALERLLTYHEPMPMLRTQYRGQDINFTGAQVANWPLFVLAYQHTEDNYSFVANMAWVTLLLVMLSFLILLGLILGNYLINRKYSGYTNLQTDPFPWLRPQKRFQPQYRQVMLFLSLITVVAIVFLSSGYSESFAADLIGMLLIGPTLVHLFQYRVLHLQAQLEQDRSRLNQALQIASRLSLVMGLFLAASLFDWRADSGGYQYAWAVVILVLMLINGVFLGLKGGHNPAFRTFIFQNLFLLSLCSGIAELLDTYSFLRFIGLLLLLGELWFLFRKWIQSKLKAVRRPEKKGFHWDPLHKHSGQPRYLFEHQVMQVMGNLVGVLIPAALLFVQLGHLQEVSRIKQEHLDLVQCFEAKQADLKPWLAQRPQPLADRAAYYLQRRGVYLPDNFIYRPEQSYYQEPKAVHRKRSMVYTESPLGDSLVQQAPKSLLTDSTGLFDAVPDSLISSPPRLPNTQRFAKVLSQLLSFINYDAEAFMLTQADTTVDGAYWEEIDNLAVFNVPDPDKEDALLFALATSRDDYSLFGHWIDFFMVTLVLVLLVGMLLLLRYLTWQFYGFKFAQLPWKNRPPTPQSLTHRQEPVRLLYITPPQSELYSALAEAKIPTVALIDFEAWPEDKKILAVTRIDDQLSPKEGTDALKRLMTAAAQAQRSLILVSNRYPSQVIADYAQMTQGDMEMNETVLKWMETLSQFQEVIYPLQMPTGEDQIATELTMQQMVEAEYQSVPFFRNRPRAFEVAPETVEEDDTIRHDALLPNITHGGYTYYSHLWHSLSSKEQFLLFDLADDGFVNPRNTTPMLSLMAKGLVVWDESRDRLRMMNRSFAHFITDEVGKDEGKRIKQQMRSRGTWSSIRWIIMILLLAVLCFVAISQPKLFEDVDAILALVAGFTTLLPTFTSLFGSNSGSS